MRFKDIRTSTYVSWKISEHRMLLREGKLEDGSAFLLPRIREEEEFGGEEESINACQSSWSESLRVLDDVFVSPCISFSCSPQGNLSCNVITHLNTRTKWFTWLLLHPLSTLPWNINNWIIFPCLRISQWNLRKISSSAVHPTSKWVLSNPKNVQFLAIKRIW